MCGPPSRRTAGEVADASGRDMTVTFGVLGAMLPVFTSRRWRPGLGGVGGEAGVGGLEGCLDGNDRP